MIPRHRIRPRVQRAHVNQSPHPCLFRCLDNRLRGPCVDILECLFLNFADDAYPVDDGVTTVKGATKRTSIQDVPGVNLRLPPTGKLAGGS